MDTIWKIVGGIVVLLVLIVVGLNLYFTNERLKNTVMPYLNETVGRPVQVETMSLSFFTTFPHPGVEIEQLHIPGRAEGDTLLSLNRLVIGVELFPLLSNEVNITELVLEHPVFTYKIYPDSTTNIDFLLSAEETDTTQTEGYNISIPYFQVSNGYFGYKDFTSGTTVTMDDFDGDLSLSYADSIATGIDVEIGGFSLAADSVHYVNDLPISLSEESVIYPEREIVRLKEGTFAIRGLTMDLTGMISNWSQTPAVDLQLSSSSDNFGALLKLVPETYAEYTSGLETEGSLTLEGTIQGPVGGKNPPSFDLFVQVKDGYMKDPDLPQPIKDIQITANATNQIVTVKKLQAQAGANSLSGSGTLNDPLKDNSAFKIDFVADVDLSTVHQFYDIAEAGIEQLNGQLAVDATAKGTLAQPDQATFTGQAILTEGLLKYEEVPKAIKNINIHASGSQALLTIQNFDIQAGKNSLSASGDIRDILDKDNRYIDMDTDLRFDLSTLKNFYPIEEDTLRLKGLLTAHATLDGPARKIAEAVQSGSITLKNGFVDYHTMETPFRNITFEAVLEGEDMIIAEAGLNSGDNEVAATGVITHYLSEDRTVNLQTNGSIKLSQISNYYELKPAITKLTGNADFNLNIQGPVKNPAAMDFLGNMTVKGASMQGETLAEAINNLNGTFALKPDKASLKSLTFTIGSSDVDISGALTNYMQYLKKEKQRSVVPRLTGQFHSEYLNVDELVDWNDTTSSTFSMELPYLNSSVQATIGKLVIHGVTMHNLVARAATTPKQIKLTKAHIDLFEGSGDGTLLWKIPEGRPSTLNFKGSLDSLRLGSFFKAYPILGADSEFFKFISGTFSTKVDYTTKIDTALTPLIPTTRLTGNFGMSQATISNHPLQKNLIDFIGIEQFSQVALDQWKSSIAVKNSVLHINDLTLTSDDIGLELNGTHHLVSDKIDFAVTLLLPQRFKQTVASVITSRAASALSSNNGTLRVPLRITGTYNNPKLQPDQRVIQPLIKDYLKDKAGNVLQNLFGGGDDEKKAKADSTL